MKGRFTKQIKSKLVRRLSKYIRLLIIAALLAGLLTLLATFVGLDGYALAVTLDPIGVTIGPVGLLFTLFLIVTALGFVGRKIAREFGTEIHEAWVTKPIWVRTLVVGFLSAAIATESVVLTDLFAYPLPTATAGITFVLSFPFASFLTLRYLRQDAGESWDLAVTAGLVLAGLTAGGVVAVDVYYMPVSNYYATVAFLSSWPILAVLTVRRLGSRSDDPESDPFLATVLIKTGYAQLERLETRTVAVLLGFAVALFVGGGLWTNGVALLVSAAVAVVTWPLVALLGYSHFEKKRRRHERSDLVIVEVAERERSGARELLIRNDGTEPISLTNAKIRDTEYDRYRLGLDLTISAGERCAFDIPPEFSLEPNDIGYALPLGYTLKQGAPAPVIYTRDGESFALYHEDIDTDDLTGQEFDWYRPEQSGTTGGEPTGQD